MFGFFRRKRDPLRSFNIQDVERLARDLGLPQSIHLTAAKWSSLPDSVPASPDEDEGERRIVENARDSLLSHAQLVGDEEVERREKRASYQIDDGFPERIVARAKTEANSTVFNYREDREKTLAEIREAEDHIRRTQVLYGLSREPRYAKNRILVFALAFLVIGIETLVNGAVIADSGSGGLFAGWSLAFMISLGNVGFGGLGSWLTLRLWTSGYIDVWKRWAAAVVAVSTIISIVWVNLAVADLREVNKATIETGTPSLFAGGVLPNTIDSLLIFTLGLIIALMSAMKFGLLSDPVPELEAASRRMNSAVHRLQRMDRAAPKVLQQIAEFNVADLQDKIDENEEIVTSFAQSLIESSSAEAAYGVACERISNIHEQLLRLRRERLGLASSVVPNYWNEAEISVATNPPVLFEIETDKKAEADLISRFHRLTEKAAAAEREIESVHEAARKMVELIPSPRLAKTGKTANNVVHLRFREPLAGHAV